MCWQDRSRWSNDFRVGAFLVSLRLYGDEFAVPVIVCGERSTVDTAGVETDGVFALYWMVVNSMAEEDAVRSVVVVVPERPVVSIPVWGTHSQQFSDGVGFERSLGINAAMHNKHVVERYRDRKRFEVFAVPVAEPVRVLVAAHDLLLVVSTDGDETWILTDEVNDTWTVRSFSDGVANEDDAIVVI